MANLRLRAIQKIFRTKTAGSAANLDKGIAAKAPVSEEIKPGTLFNAENIKQFKELTAGDHPAAIPAPVSEEDEEPAGDVTSEDKTIAKMTKSELVAFAKESGFDVDKKDAVEVVREAVQTAFDAGSSGADNELV